MSERKRRWRVSGSYTVTFEVDMEADSEAEAVANVRDYPPYALESALSETLDVDACEEVAGDDDE